METVAIITNKKKDCDLSVTNKVTDILKDKFNILYSDGLNHKKTAQIMRNSDYAIVVGGDGTILSTANIASLNDVPILGINLGNLGFLANVELSELPVALKNFSEKIYTIDERFMLEAICHKTNGRLVKFTSLNDIVISRASYTKVVEVEIYINDHYVASYDGDGVIVATPTGSTAYSLSAGGPLVDSSLDVFVLTPICPHTMSSKPIIVSGSSEITIRFKGTFAEKTMVTSDGFKAESIEDGDEIHVKACEKKAKLIKLNDRNFYQLLHKKFQG